MLTTTRHMTRENGGLVTRSTSAIGLVCGPMAPVSMILKPTLWVQQCARVQQCLCFINVSPTRVTIWVYKSAYRAAVLHFLPMRVSRIFFIVCAIVGSTATAAVELGSSNFAATVAHEPLLLVEFYTAWLDNAERTAIHTNTRCNIQVWTL